MVYRTKNLYTVFYGINGIKYSYSIGNTTVLLPYFLSRERTTLVYGSGYGYTSQKYFGSKNIYIYITSTKSKNQEDFYVASCPY